MKKDNKMEDTGEFKFHCQPYDRIVSENDCYGCVKWDECPSRYRLVKAKHLWIGVSFVAAFWFFLMVLIGLIGGKIQ